MSFSSRRSVDVSTLTRPGGSSTGRPSVTAFGGRPKAMTAPISAPVSVPEDPVKPVAVKPGALIIEADPFGAAQTTPVKPVPVVHVVKADVTKPTKPVKTCPLYGDRCNYGADCRHVARPRESRESSGTCSVHGGGCRYRTNCYDHIRATKSAQTKTTKSSTDAEGWTEVTRASKTCARPAAVAAVAAVASVSATTTPVLNAKDFPALAIARTTVPTSALAQRPVWFVQRKTAATTTTIAAAAATADEFGMWNNMSMLASLRQKMAQLGHAELQAKAEEEAARKEAAAKRAKMLESSSVSARVARQTNEGFREELGADYVTVYDQTFRTMGGHNKCPHCSSFSHQIFARGAMYYSHGRMRGVYMMHGSEIFRVNPESTNATKLDFVCTQRNMVDALGMRHNPQYRDFSDDPYRLFRSLSDDLIAANPDVFTPAIVNLVTACPVAKQYGSIRSGRPFHSSMFKEYRKALNARQVLQSVMLYDELGEAAERLVAKYGYIAPVETIRTTQPDLYEVLMTRVALETDATVDISQAGHLSALVAWTRFDALFPDAMDPDFFQKVGSTEREIESYAHRTLHRYSDSGRKRDRFITDLMRTLTVHKKLRDPAGYFERMGIAVADARPTIVRPVATAAPTSASSATDTAAAADAAATSTVTAAEKPVMTEEEHARMQKAVSEEVARICQLEGKVFDDAPVTCTRGMSRKVRQFEASKGTIVVPCEIIGKGSLNEIRVLADVGTLKAGTLATCTKLKESLAKRRKAKMNSNTGYILLVSFDTKEDGSVDLAFAGLPKAIVSVQEAMAHFKIVHNHERAGASSSSAAASSTTTSGINLETAGSRAGFAFDDEVVDAAAEDAESEDETEPTDVSEIVTAAVLEDRNEAYGEIEITTEDLAELEQIRRELAEKEAARAAREEAERVAAAEREAEATRLAAKAAARMEAQAEYERRREQQRIESKVQKVMAATGCDREMAMATVMEELEAQKAAAEYEAACREEAAKYVEPEVKTSKKRKDKKKDREDSPREVFEFDVDMI